MKKDKNLKTTKIVHREIRKGVSDKYLTGCLTVK